jgi:hypothetical protein
LKEEGKGGGGEEEEDLCPGGGGFIGGSCLGDKRKLQGGEAERGEGGRGGEGASVTSTRCVMKDVVKNRKQCGSGNGME